MVIQGIGHILVQCWWGGGGGVELKNRGAVPVWKVCIARGRNPPRTFDAFYIFTIKFSKSPPCNFQTFQSGCSQSGPHLILGC